MAQAVIAASLDSEEPLLRRQTDFCFLLFYIQNRSGLPLPIRVSVTQRTLDKLTEVTLYLCAFHLNDDQTS